MTNTLSLSRSIAQLQFVWPGLVREKRSEIMEALKQVTPEWIAQFKADNPRCENVVIYRLRKHEIMIRGIKHGNLSVHWVDHPRLLGKTKCWGNYAGQIQQERIRPPKRPRQPRHLQLVATAAA